MKRNRLLCLLLASLLVIGSLTVVLLSVSAGTAEAPTVPGVETLPSEAVWDGKTVSESLSGQGTAADPFLIQSPADFVFYCRNMATYAAEGKYAKQTADFSLNGKWHGNPSATSTADLSDLTLAGQYDGDHHVIYNAKMANPFNWNNANCALFGVVSGTLSDLTLQDAQLLRNGSGKNYAGIALTVSGTVKNCRVLDVTIDGKDNAAGIATTVSGSVIGCTVSGTITSTGAAAGIAASVSNSAAAVTMENCTNYADVTTSGTSNLGGIVGSISSTVAVIRNCRNYGKLEKTATATGGYVGGIVASHTGRSDGFAPKGLTLDGCLNAGEILGGVSLNVGGLVGNAQKVYADVTIRNCSVTGNVSGGSNVGGLIGYHEPWAYTTSNLQIFNSHVTADVTASGNNAGLAIGKNIIHGSGANFQVTNCMLSGKVTAASGAGAVVGMLAAQKAMSPKFGFLNDYVNATVIVAAEGKAATLIGDADSNVSGVSLTSTDAKVLVTVKVDGAEVTAPVTYYINDGTGVTAELTALDAAELKNGTARASLNAYATENDLAKWSQGATAPVLTAFYDWPAVFTNATELSHPYTGLAVAAKTQAKRADVARVVVAYYRKSDMTTPLSGAPSAVGEYKAILRVFDENGVELDQGNEFSVAFEITQAATQLFVDFSGLTDNGDGTYSIGYTGSEIILPVTVKNMVTDAVAEDAIPTTTVTSGGAAASAILPGTYEYAISFAGDANYAAAEPVTVTIRIGKRQVEYPDNRWTANGTDILAENAELTYNGHLQKVTLMGADESIFAVIYTNNQATNAGGAMIATATVSLRADVAEYYELVGTAPDYSLTWTLAQASTRIITVRDASDVDTQVDLSRYEYTGSEENFYVIYVDSADNIIGVPENNVITVSGAVSFDRSFYYAGDNNYCSATLVLSVHILPKDLGENGGTHEDLNPIYNGKEPVFAPNFGPAPTGTTWSSEFTKRIERKNGDAYETLGEAILGGEYRVTFYGLTVDGNYQASFTVSFTIRRATATVTPPVIGWEKDGDVWTVVYDGNTHPFAVTSDSDATPVVTYDRDGKTDLPKVVGTYTVTVSYAQTDNYEAVSETFTVRVDKMIIPTVPDGTALWDYAGAYTYDGTPKNVTVKATYFESYKAYLQFSYTQDKDKTQAGDYTTKLTLSLKDTVNTGFEETEGTDVVRILTWKISKRVLSVAGVGLSDVSWTYNGTAYTVQVTLPSELVGNVSVRYEWELDGEAYTDEIVNAGVYSVVAVLTPIDSIEFEGGTSEYRTAPATVEITQNEAEIIVDGKVRDFSVTFGGENADPLAGLKLIGSDGTEFSVGDYLVFTVTKNGTSTSLIRDAGVYLVTVSVRENANVAAEDLTRTITINRATYAVDGKITVVGDTTYIAGKAGTITLRVAVTGADNVSVTVDESRLPELPSTPGVHTVTYYLKGSDNYEPLEAYSFEVTVKQAEATDDGYKDVGVIFENGADPDVKLEIAENEIDTDIKDLLLGSTDLGLNIVHPKLDHLYRYTFKDADGTTVKYSELGDVSVVITLPKQYQGYDKDELFDIISVVSVTYKKGVATKMTVEKAGNITYDAEAGTLTFKVSSPDVAYGFVREVNPIATYVMLGIGGAALLAVIALTILRIVGASRRTRPEGPDTPDDNDAGFSIGYSAGAEYAPYSSDSDAYTSAEDSYADGAYAYGEDTVNAEMSVDASADTEELLPDEASFTDETPTEEIPLEDTPAAEETVQTPAEEQMPIPDEMLIPDEDTPRGGE